MKQAADSSAGDAALWQFFYPDERQEDPGTTGHRAARGPVLDLNLTGGGAALTPPPSPGASFRDRFPQSDPMPGRSRRR